VWVNRSIFFGDIMFSDAVGTCRNGYSFDGNDFEKTFSVQFFEACETYSGSDHEILGAVPDYFNF
jgi:hypothetical protein